MSILKLRRFKVPLENAKIICRTKDLHDAGNETV
jgi:hypothetical protein